MSRSRIRKRNDTQDLQNLNKEFTKAKRELMVKYETLDRVLAEYKVRSMCF